MNLEVIEPINHSFTFLAKVAQKLHFKYSLTQSNCDKDLFVMKPNSFQVFFQSEKNSDLVFFYFLSLIFSILRL